MAPAVTPGEFADSMSPPPPPGEPYGVPVPGTERENRTPAYRNFRVGDGPLVERYSPEIETMFDMFEASWKPRPGKKCLGWRPWNPAAKTWENKYAWLTYGEVAERRKNLGAGLVEVHKRAGVTADKHGVALWSQNRPEWQITELACHSQSLWAVSLYETFGPEATEYILNHSSLTAVVCSLPHIPTLLKMAPRTPSVKIIVSLDPLDDGEMAGHSKRALLNKLAADVGIEIYSMADVEAIGQRSGRLMHPPKKDDILTINYTSGTTGNPKGVVLTHANGVAAITTALSTGTVHERDVHISYLPVAHIYGRMIDQAAITAGAMVGYFHGDVASIVEDLKVLKPTSFISVPRLFNRISSAIQAQTLEADGVRGALSRHIVNSKKAWMKLPPGQATNKHLLYDRIWTRKVLAAVGLERAHSMISGSAQLDPDVQEFLRAAFANNFAQGWGMTETFAVGTIQLRDDFSLGNIGAPFPGIELCLESAPDLEYCVTDKPNPRGELLVRGPFVFKEYYNNVEETAKCLEADGWLHTGDICEVDSMGRFKIIDRKKNVLKLAQGEYISPERIENVYMANCNLITTAFVHGDPKQHTLVAVFGIDPEHLPPFAGKILKRTIPRDDPDALRAAANDPEVKRALLKLLDGIGRHHKFNSYERVRNCYMDIEPFTIDNELLTPTMKLKRPQAARAYKAQIERMYEEVVAQETKARL